MPSSTNSVSEYLAQLPTDRAEIICALREIILRHLPAGYHEGIQYGMLSYYIPLSDYPVTYNKQPLSYLALASQKNYLSLYLMGIYAAPGGEENFRRRYVATGKKLNMGKSCLRFTNLDQLPLDLLAEVIAETPPARFIEFYEASRKR